MGPAVGTVMGLLSWFALTLKSAFALVGIWAFAEKIFPFDTRAVLVGLAVFFTVLNLWGTKSSSLFQVIFVIVLLSLTRLFVVLGFPHVPIRNYEPFTP